MILININTHLQHILGEIDGDDARAAAHAGQIEALNVRTHLKLVDDHCGERRCRIEPDLKP